MTPSKPARRGMDWLRNQILDEFRETIGLTFRFGRVTLRVSAFGTLVQKRSQDSLSPGLVSEKVRSRFPRKSAPTDTQGLPDELGVNVHGLM
jgi:hypothetical protein